MATPQEPASAVCAQRTVCGTEGRATVEANSTRLRGARDYRTTSFRGARSRHASIKPSTRCELTPFCSVNMPRQVRLGRIWNADVRDECCLVLRVCFWDGFACCRSYPSTRLAPRTPRGAAVGSVARSRTMGKGSDRPLWPKADRPCILLRGRNSRTERWLTAIA